MEGWEFELRPGAGALTEVLEVLERAEDNRHLSNLVCVAQVCDAMEAVYGFSSLGPEPMAPVSGQLEYDLVLLEAKGQIVDAKQSSIVLAAGRARSSSNYRYVKNAAALSSLGALEPARLAAMAKLAMLREVWQDDEIVIEKAARSLFMSEVKARELLSDLDDCSA